MEDQILTGSRRARGGTKANSTVSAMSDNNDSFESQGAFKDEQGSIYNPLGAPTVEREYSRPAIDNSLTGDISEPVFHQISVDDLPDDETGNNEPSEIGNPDLIDADAKEKRLGARMAVDELLSKYALLHQVGAHFAKMSDNKMQQMYANNELDPQLVVTTPQGNATVADVVEGYNASCDDAIKYDPEFGEKVRKPLERIFAKRGIGLTDEQAVALAFAEDIGVKAVTIYSLKSTINQTLKSISLTYTEQIRRQNSQNTVAPPPPPPPAPSSRQKVKKEEEEFVRGNEPEEAIDYVEVK